MAAPREIVLNCLVFGEEPYDIFRVRIAENAFVDDLKNSIKSLRENTFRDVDASQLALHNISLPDDDVLEERLVNLVLGKPLRPLRKLSICFADIQEDHLHVIIKLPTPPAHTIQVPEAELEDSLTELLEPFKKLMFSKGASLSPSQSAKSSEYAKIQASDLRLMDCRYSVDKALSTVAPPIQLFHPAFAYFITKAFNPGYDVPDDFFRKVRGIVDRFAGIHPTERDRHSNLKFLLEETIHSPLEYIKNDDNTSPDFVGIGLSGRYLIIGEEKNEFGNGRSDPSVQVSFSYLRLLSQKANRDVGLKCCCPTFLIAHAGPWLTIMGSIITTHCVVQRLTDFLWIPVHSVNDDEQIFRIARVLYALREAKQQLDLWYQTIAHVTPLDVKSPTPHPRFFPYPKTYLDDETHLPVRFEYQQKLEREASCVTYRARTVDGPQRDIVVKFVTRYGADVHREMALHRFAPRLLYCGPINVNGDEPSYGRHRMVVMEYVEGLTFGAALSRQQVPAGFKEDLRRAMEHLHGAGYVFGDLRYPNVMVTPGGTSTAQLIDFDWAGVEGEVKYPVMISGSIDWPLGVEGLGPILKEHDLTMLESFLPGH